MSHTRRAEHPALAGRDGSGIQQPSWLLSFSAPRSWQAGTGQKGQADRRLKPAEQASRSRERDKQVGAQLVAHRHRRTTRSCGPGRPAAARPWLGCRGSAAAAGPGRCAAHWRAHSRRSRSSLLPADPYRDRRFFTCCGVITTTVRPATSSASTTGPLLRSIAVVDGNVRGHRDRRDQPASLAWPLSAEGASSPRARARATVSARRCVPSLAYR